MCALLVVIAVAVLTVAAGSPAWASPRNVVGDCTDNGRIDRRHSAWDYAAALRRLPSDVDEYTECRRIIEDAARKQGLNRFRAYVRHVTFSRRGRRIHFWLHLPPCRTARPGALRFEFRALRPGRGVAVATAPRQCRPRFRTSGRIRGVRLATPKPYRVTVELVGRHPRTARYYVRVLAGGRVTTREPLVRHTTRAGRYRYE